ncbi:MAG TPA: CoA pyrophosphatase [Sphingomicrobium sp.]|nr:CoA pyrophosphatase [Sphingomicrobium sp.]
MSLAKRLRAALRDQPCRPLLTGDDPSAGNAAPPAEAAVLIAVTDRSEPGLILTVRREDLRTHAGQVAFPGGRIDPGEDATGAAVREAWEELEMPVEQVEPITELDPYRTITGYRVTPVLAAIPADLPLAPHQGEVADWFEAPLAFLIDPANHQRKAMLFDGQTRHYYEIVWAGQRIWGATAAMLVNLSRRLRWS